MIKNYIPSEYKTEEWHEICFDDGHNNGFGFRCDEYGNLVDADNPAAVANLNRCREHPEDFKRFDKIVKFSSTYLEPARGTCSCGEEIELLDQYMGASECPYCGQWYNLFGQELEPPERWEM